MFQKKIDSKINKSKLEDSGNTNFYLIIIF